jgi:mannitol/fructose-specific phosphotransferase system IIA component (Ntr-type)
MTSLRDHLEPADIRLAVQAGTKHDILAELVGLLGLGAEPSSVILKVLERREALGSTGIGHGVAIPHCRTHLVPRLRVVLGRKSAGVDWGAVDAQPVTWIFLLAAPPVEVANDYLPVLGRIAQLMKDAGVRERLDATASPAEVLALIRDLGV